MICYNESARQSALENIARLQRVIATIPGNYLSYTDAEELRRYLDDLTMAIKEESRRNEKQG